MKAGKVLGARSIKLFERSRPWLRRTRSLWEFNEGKMGCGGAPELRDRAEQATVAKEEVRQEQNSRQEKTEERGETRFVERQGTPRPSVPRRAQISCCRELSHAAAGTRSGGERSWISAAVSLSMTLIGPPHWGQSRRSCVSWAVDSSGSVCGAEPSK